MPQITLSNGRQFSAEAGVPLLDAAAAQAVLLEHSCRTGRCGSCKARLLGGQAQPLREGLALSPAERAAGWILTCTDGAATDLALDIEDLGALAGLTPRTVPARIHSLERLAPDVLQVVLRLPPNAGFAFLPGQSIDLSGPTGVRRSYSLAGDAAAPDRIVLQIRRVDGGALSAWWFEQARVNDLLRFHGPRGTFFLRPLAGLDLVLLATGTGLAPFLSMLMQIARLPTAEQPASVTLYWGGRRPEDLYLALPAGQAGLPADLRYVPVLSRADADWAGARGHVQDVLLAEGRELSGAVVYACGSQAMIRAAETALQAAGLPARRFFYDAFVSSS